MSCSRIQHSAHGEAPSSNPLISSQSLCSTQGFFFVILGRGPRVFQIGKSSMVNPYYKIGKFVIVHNYVIFGQ